MTAQKKLFLDFDNFSSRIVGDDLTAIVLDPLPYAKIHDGSIQGFEVLSLQNVEIPQVVFTAYDDISNIGSYCVDPSTNSILILVDSDTITTDQLAKNFIQGILTIYDMISLEYFGSTELYQLSTSYSNGVFVGSTNPTTFSVLENKISAYSSDINVNDIGYYEFKITRVLSAV